jgi:hypothetical protein
MMWRSTSLGRIEREFLADASMAFVDLVTEMIG